MMCRWCVYMCVWDMCVYDMCVMYYDTHRHHTHTYGCVCAFEWSETWVLVFSPSSFWGLLLVAAYAWLTGPQASGDCPVSDSHSSRNTETAQSTFCFTQVLGVQMKILRLSKHFTHWAVPPPPQQTCYLLMKQAWGRKDQILDRREMEMEKRSWIGRSKRKWKCILSHVLAISLTLRILHSSFPWSRQCRGVRNECVESAGWEGPQKTAIVNQVTKDAHAMFVNRALGNEGL